MILFSILFSIFTKHSCAIIDLADWQASVYIINHYGFELNSRVFVFPFIVSFHFGRLVDVVR